LLNSTGRQQAKTGGNRQSGSEQGKRRAISDFDIPAGALFHVAEMIRVFWTAWEPVTPRGVAAFARAGTHRLWLVQVVIACLTSLAIGWLLHRGVFPGIGVAAANLPETGEIRDARLNWGGDSPQMLAEGRVISLAVDLNHDGGARSPAHWHVEFGREDVLLCSLLGCVTLPYPGGWWIAANRVEVLPKWGAWEKPLLAITVMIVGLGLVLVWQMFALIYALPVWLLGYFANRRLALPGAWKLGGAAQMPGALLMTAAVLCYERGLMDMLPLAFVFAGHMILTWLYLAISPWFVPPVQEAVAAPENPFKK
jgi:hypothetical protein